MNEREKKIGKKREEEEELIQIKEEMEAKCLQKNNGERENIKRQDKNRR